MVRRNSKASLGSGKPRSALMVTHPNAAGIDIGSASCQWLQQLMTYGLLIAAFRPAEQVCTRRSL